MSHISFTSFPHSISIYLYGVASTLRVGCLTLLCWLASTSSFAANFDLAKKPLNLQDLVFYYIDVQKFANGSASDDPLKERINHERATPNNQYFAGDLQGIINHLDYLTELGVNALWLSPIFEKRKEHQSTLTLSPKATTVSPLFGHEQDLILLVKEAAKRGIRTFLSIDQFTIADANYSPYGFMSTTQDTCQDMLLPEITYFNCQYLDPYELLDNSFLEAAKFVVAENNPSGLLETLYSYDDIYRDQDVFKILRIVSSPFSGRLSDAVFDANAEDFEFDNLQRAKMMYALTFFGNGIPVIMFGDEQGFMSNKVTMDSFDQMSLGTKQYSPDTNTTLLASYKTATEENFDTDHPLFQAIKTFSKLYQDYDAIRYGIHTHHEVSDNHFYSFSRVLAHDNEEILFFFNLYKEPKTVSIKVNADQYMSIYPYTKAYRPDELGRITIDVEGLDFIALKATKPVKLSTEIPSIKAFYPASGEVLSGIVNIEIETDDISSLNHQGLPLYLAKFEAQVGEGPMQLIGYDYAPPYRTYWDISRLNQNTKVKLKATIQDFNGDQIVKENTVYIDAVASPQIFSARKQREKIMTQEIEKARINIKNQTLTRKVLEKAQQVEQARVAKALAEQEQLTREREALEAELASLQASQVSGGLGTDEGTKNQLKFADNPPFSSPIYLRGTIVGTWEPVMAFDYIGEDKYEVTLSLTEQDYEFKIADEDWQLINLGLGHDIVVNYESPLHNSSLSENIYLTIESDGEYTLTLDVSNVKSPRLKVTRN